MHYFGTVNLDIISEFITTVIFFLFFFFNCKCTMQVHRSQTKPDHQHVLVQTSGMVHCPMRLGSVVLVCFQVSTLLCVTFLAISVEIINCILKSSPDLPLFLGILCIRLWGRCSRRHSWFAFQMVWFVQVIFCLYWDGLISLFFLDDLKL